MMNHPKFEVFYEDVEPSVLFYNGRQIETNGHAFELKKRELEKLDVEHLPYDIAFEPLLDTGYAAGFVLINTKQDGLIAEFNVMETNKYWSNPIFSLGCYMTNKVAEIKENENFVFIDFDDEDDAFINLNYQIKLSDVSSLKKAFLTIEEMSKDLEERVLQRVARNIKQWADGVA